MKVALAPGGDLIRRVGRVLLADPRVDLVGVHHAPSGDPRVVTVEDLSEFDVVVAEQLGLPETQKAWDRRIPIVIADRLVSPERADLITDGADLEGLAVALADLARQRSGAPDADLAWTRTGRPLRSGPRVVFPQPVGPLFAHREGDALVAPTASDLAAILVTASGRLGTVTYGMVDHAGYLAAICLAAAVLARGTGSGGPAHDLGERFVEEALAAGASVASKTN